ncbi:MAG: SpoIIE family protein phosphatase, partial [Clostridia bacterium]|nr:SpoIIE family protein phosphatase [Clostridia bacterium]
PFGVGLAASVSGPGALFIYVATLVGYLLGGDTLFLLRYLAAVTVAAGVRWSFAGLKGPKAALVLPPVAGFLGALSAGLAVQVVGGLTLYTTLALLCEGALAAGFGWLCTLTDRLLRTPREESGLLPAEQVAVTTVAAVAVMSLSPVMVGDVSLGHVLAMMTVLLFARSGKEQGGGIAGVALGTALLLTEPEAAGQGVALAFGGLMAGVFARINRFAAAGMFLITATLVAMGSGNGELTAWTAYEAAVAAMLFTLLPASLDRHINGFFLRGQEMPAVEGLRRSVVWRLDYAARAMGEVAGTVDAVSRRMAAISAPDIGSLCRGVSEDLCRRCPHHLRCWDSGFSDTMAAFNALTETLRKEGSVGREQVTGRLKDCPQNEASLARINEGYSRFLMRESAFRRLGEIRAVAGDQFHAMATMLGELSAIFADPAAVDEAAAARVREVCEGHGLSVDEVLCTVAKGRMEVCLMVPDTDWHFDEQEWRQGVSDACGRTFQRPEIRRLGSTARVTLREQPRLGVKVGQATLCTSGEKLCGDAAEVFADSEGRTVLVLSDGMGCGGRAAVDGAMAAGLTARLLQAGFGADSVLRMVNAALMVKGGDESLATLDIAAIDPFTGRLDSLKAGAAVSLLRSGGRVSRIEQSSLPLGILREVSFAHSTDTLTGGDILLLFSDGAVSESVAAAEEILRDYDDERGSMQNLAEQVAGAARRLQQAAGGREDDITVLAARVYIRG